MQEMKGCTGHENIKAIRYCITSQQNIYLMILWNFRIISKSLIKVHGGLMGQHSYRNDTLLDVTTPP